MDYILYAQPSKLITKMCCLSLPNCMMFNLNLVSFKKLDFQLDDFLDVIYKFSLKVHV